MPGWRGFRKRVRQPQPELESDSEVLCRVQQFHAEYGTSRVPRAYVCSDGFELGSVLYARRQRIPEHSSELLEAIGALPELRGSFDQQGFAHLWDYQRDHQSACVPRSYVAEDGFRLGSWVGRGRAQRGHDPRMDALLESIPGWTWAAFDRSFDDQLKRFKRAAESGRLAGDLRLHRWIRYQVRAARAGKLSPERLVRLEEAGVPGLHVHRGHAARVCTTHVHESACGSRVVSA